ncbi:hypothetical protein HK097_000620, partial [Rhizophlyctis rosea]
MVGKKRTRASTKIPTTSDNIPAPVDESQPTDSPALNHPDPAPADDEDPDLPKPKRQHNDNTDTGHSQSSSTDNTKAPEEESSQPFAAAAQAMDTDQPPAEADSSSKPTTTAASRLAAQMERLAKLKASRAEAERLNRKEVHAVDRKEKENPKAEIRHAKKKREAEILQMQQNAKKEGVDYERARAIEYTVESVERWEEKRQEKKERANTGFSDHNQIAAKAYGKRIKELKPNLVSYNEQRIVAGGGSDEVDDGFYRGADSLAYAGVDSKASPAAIERVARDVEKAHEMRGKSSRRRAFNEDDDVTYVNERNMNFNKKISRAYDKYTADIRA